MVTKNEKKNYNRPCIGYGERDFLVRMESGVKRDAAI